MRPWGRIAKTCKIIAYLLSPEDNTIYRSPGVIYRKAVMG